MRRSIDSRGVVHYVNPLNPAHVLCGDVNGDRVGDLFHEEYAAWKATDAKVTCIKCAAVVNAIKNEPYNQAFGNISDAIRDAACYAAAKGVE